MLPRTELAVTVLLVVGAASGSARAQSEAIPVMSLREAIHYARLHQPTLAAARARAAAARSQAEVPRAQFSPTITAGVEALVGTENNTTASYASLGALDVTRVGGTPANAAVSWSPEPSTLVGVSLHQQLFDFGRYEAQSDAYDALARAAVHDTAGQDLDLTLLIEDSFYAVQGAKAVLVASQAAVARAREHRDFAQARVSAQLQPPIDLTRAEADLARFEVDVVKAAGAVTVAQSVLAAAIGASVFGVDAGVDDVTYPTPPVVASATDEAAVRDPQLLAARERLTAQQSLTRSIRDELRPNLSFSAEFTGRAGGTAVAANPTPLGNGWLPSVPNWDALVVVSWPIFDRVVDARAQTSQRVEAVRAAEISQVSEQLNAALAGTYVELDVAQKALPALQRAQDAAVANQTQADARFKAGLGSAVELADSEALLVDAQIQFAIGNFQLARARARVQRALAQVTP